MAMKKWLAKGQETCYFVRQRMAFLANNLQITHRKCYVWFCGIDFEMCLFFFYMHTNTKICLKGKQWWPKDQTFAFLRYLIAVEFYSKSINGKLYKKTQQLSVTVLRVLGKMR